MSDVLPKMQEALRFLRVMLRSPADEVWVTPEALAEVADAMIGGIEALGGTVEDEPTLPDPVEWIQGYLLEKLGKPALKEDIADVLEAWNAYDDEYGGSITFRPDVDNEE